MLIAAGAVVLFFASLQDIAVRILPNWCAAFVLSAGAALRAIDGSLLVGGIAALVVFLGATLCWRRGWLGGGDVKMLAACALLVPPGEVLAMLLTTSLAGGVLAIAYLAIGWNARRRALPPAVPRPSSLIMRVVRVERWRIARGGPLPYGCAIAFAAIFVSSGPFAPWR